MSFAEVDAYTAGRMVGRISVVLLLLAGILKCVLISRRPTTNSKCAWSLALFLGIFLVPAVASFLPRFTPALAPLVYLGRVILIVLLLGASLTLAIIGLVECGRERGRFVQGRAQAIWALVLCGIFLFFALTGAALALMHAQHLFNPSTGGQIFAFREMNFRFSAPARPWVKVDAARLNREAKLAFIRNYPETYFIIIAEPMGKLEYPPETLANLALVRMQSASDSCHVLVQRPLVVGKLSGLEVHTQAQLQNHSIIFVQWFCVTNGWAYQLCTWGQSSEIAQVDQGARQLMNGFSLIDYQSRAPILGGEAIRNYVSTNFAYRVHLADPGWIKWAKLDSECPYASFGVLHRENAALMVSAISLARLKAEPQAIYQGFLNLLTKSDVLNDAREIHEQNLRGIGTTFDQPLASGKEFTFRFKILQGGGFAYLVAAWAESQNPDKEKILNEAMSAVEFLDTPPLPPAHSTLSAQEKRAERMVFNQIGMVYFNEQSYEQSAALFKAAVDLDGLQKGTAYLENLTMARIRQGNYQLALNELEQHPEYVDSQPALAAERAFLQGQLGQIDLALTNYAKLFATGYHGADAFKGYLGLLVQTQQIKRASDEVNSYLQTEDSPEIRLAQADLLKQSQKYDEAITLLQAQREKYPYDVGISLSLGDAFIRAGKWSVALSLSDEMLRQDGDLAGIWLLKGRAQFALKWYREARESFNKVIAQSPSNTDARQFLQVLAGILGEGSGLASQNPIDPVPIPDVLTNTIPEPPEKFGQDEGAYYTRRISAVSFKKGDELKTTEYLRVHIISSTGVSAFSTYQLVFNPLFEEIYVNQLTVKNAAGSVVSTGSVDNYYILDDRSSSAANSKKVLNIPVADLQPGYDLELTVTRRELGRPETFTFLPYAFAASFPVLEQDLCYLGDTNAVHFASSQGIETKAFTGGLLWRENQQPVIRREPLQPSLADYLPVVYLNDASATWPNLVTNYLAMIQDRLRLPEDQKLLAQRLTPHTSNLTQKIAAIADYIQTNYTYNAIEFGHRARIPQSLSDFVSNKYGDCKDHAVLAQQMLNAAGIPTYLALVSTVQPIQKNLPSLDQFDHMVVYVPSAGENGFLDCTAKSFDVPTERYALADREALVLDPARPYFQQVPPYPTNASMVTVTRTIIITNQTSALVTEALKIKGIHAGLFRAYFRSVAASIRREYLASQFVGTLGELKDFSIEGIDDPHSALIINLSYLARRQFQLLDNEIAGNPPLNSERTFLLAQNVEKRTTPFEIPIPLAMDGSVTICVPPNFKADPPELSQNVTNPFVSCRFSATTNRTGWFLEYHIFEPSHRFSPEQYSAYNLAMQQVVSTLGPNLVCVRQ